MLKRWNNLLFFWVSVVSQNRMPKILVNCARGLTLDPPSGRRNTGAKGKPVRFLDVGRTKTSESGPVATERKPHKTFNFFWDEFEEG